jgi:hypothetical protein
MRPRHTRARATIALACLVCGCDPQQLARRGGTTRLSIATGGTGGVYYPYGGGLAKVISENLPGVEATAEVTAASVDNLKLLRDGKSDIAFTLADTLDDAKKGQGSFAGFGPVPARALAVLYSNYTHLVTLGGTRIETIADLAGRTVSLGAPGSGTEIIARRILQVSGVDPDSGIRRQNLSVGASVDALKDGKIDAFFWSGGLPTAAILDLAHTPGVALRLLASDQSLPALQRTYGPSLYFPLTIPEATYAGVAHDVAVVGVANLLVVHERMADSLAYDITRLLFEKQADLARVHPEALRLSLKTAVAGSPAPFHPGARRYYAEKGASVP